MHAQKLPVLIKKSFLIAISMLCIERPVSLFSQTPKSITLDDCFTFFKFYPQTGANFQYLKDGSHYVEADHDGILHIRDVRHENLDSTISLKLPDAAKGFDQFEFSEDETKLVLRTDSVDTAVPLDESHRVPGKVEIDDVAALALEIKLDGLVATNTTISREGLHTNPATLETIGIGGLSGLPLKDRSTKIVEWLNKKTKGQIPIIASGGIFTAADAREKLMAGASLVQVWTGFIYEGPGIVKEICKGL